MFVPNQGASHVRVDGIAGIALPVVCFAGRWRADGRRRTRADAVTVRWIEDDAGGVYQVGENGEVSEIPSGDVTGLRIDLGDGDDSLVIDSGIDLPATIYGRGGNDTIRGGSGADRVLAGA